MRDDHRRIGPRLEVDHDQQVDQHHRAQQAKQQAGEGAVHGLGLAQQLNDGAFWHLRRRLREHAADVGRDRAQVAILGGCVDLHHGCTSYWLTRALPVPRSMRARPPSVSPRWRHAVTDRQVAQRRQRVHLVLRRLHDDRVADAVGRIEPVGRRDLAAAGEVDHHAVGDVTRCQAKLLGLDAIQSTLNTGALFDCWMRASATPGIPRIRLSSCCA
jgi:hypothetical protein